ncbi:ribosome biogenesis GTPase YlqF [Pseudalkalibacillus salsuginis]|uniref:ribosome biogenesis GTPase YlqF n=1 Tax=Pseudalkalibacillus salsuginis TaxID=2910972 RepID=UPI001F02A41F|nr:ribosome biogenesis GTPase YlqF [Pseudalkalibacillus salsuginis]MCF6410547.1 ribosome biogenesis GTPase YlqF [Pseudalkalibacillus salsuginis]
MQIQWFPGHMAKARREITEKLKMIDVVFELVDARIPLSSRNPMIDEIVDHKPRLILLNKTDMADRVITKEWEEYFGERDLKTATVNSKTGQGLEKIPDMARELVKAKLEKMIEKGVKPRAVRALILGIPNVGKSTLINRLANKKIAKTGDRPGITQRQQWIKVGKELELLDTPGILWPKFEDQTTGYRLAVTGAIKDEILDFGDIAFFAIQYLKEAYPEKLMERYKLTDTTAPPLQVFEEIGKKRGCLIKGGEVDYEKAAELILRDIRSEKLGPVSFERPADYE